MVHRRLHHVRHPARHRRADGAVAAVDRLHLPDGDGRAVRGHRHHEPHLRRGRVLRRRPARSRVVQRHGDRRRLDERGVVHRHGRHAVPDGLRRSGVRHGMDRRLLPRRAVPRAVPAQVRAVHDSGLSRRALRRQYSARGRHLRRDPVLVHLRRGADLRRRPHHHAPDRRVVRARHFPGAGRHPGLLVPGRHAGGNLDAGGAVHHPDHRLHDPGGVAVGEADRHPDPADRLRQAAREGHGARGKIHQGSEGARGPRHLQGARRRRQRQAEGPARLVRRRQAGADGQGRQAEGRQRAGRPGRRDREVARGLSEGRRRRKGRLDQGRRPRRARRAAAAPRRGVSGQGRAPRATCRAAISSPWCSA